MSSTPSPILRKRKHVVSPLRASRGSDDFDDMPEYVRSVRKPRVGKLRGRYGINELAQIVGSRAYRDINRSGKFMPGQFQIWNDSENGGNGKYWGGYQDADGDGLAHEFVVRRGTATGPMIAVNGYTTKQSDWAGRKAFYEAYPKRADRKGKTVKSYMQEEYYVPTYDGMQIKEWGIQPGSGDDEFAGEEWNRYKKYTPKELTPYQAVNKYIVMPALEAHLAEINMTRNTPYITAQGIGEKQENISVNVNDGKNLEENTTEFNVIITQPATAEKFYKITVYDDMDILPEGSYVGLQENPNFIANPADCSTKSGVTTCKVSVSGLTSAATETPFIVLVEETDKDGLNPTGVKALGLVKLSAATPAQ